MAAITEPPSSSLSLVLKEYTTPPTLHLESRPLPGEAVPGRATVKILVHSLLSYSSALVSGTLQYPLSLPLVPGGGAIVRLVSDVPPDATSLSEGDLCLFTPIVRGRDDGDNAILMGIHGGATSGEKKLMEGVWRDGVFAEYANVPLENLYRLDESKLCGEMGYGFADLAYMQRLIVSMGGLCSLDVKAGERVVIAPASGSFGGAAVEAARALGADIIMVGRKKESLERIKGVLMEKTSRGGKIDVVALTGELKKDATAIGSFGVVDKYLDFSPPEAAKTDHIVACLMALKKGGTACFQGGIQAMVNMPYGLVMFKDLTTKGKFMYERDDVKRLIRQVEGGRLLLGEKGGIETVAAYGLKEWEKALVAAEKGNGWGKHAVLDPWKEQA